MKRSYLRAVTLTALTLSGALVASADIATYATADYQYTSGDASVETVFVIDWNDGTSTEAYSFGLRSSAGLNVSDAVQLLDSLSNELDADLTRYGFGDFVDRFGFDAERSSELTPTTDTAYNPVGPVNGAVIHDMSSGYAGASDHLQTGFWDGANNLFWAYTFSTGTQGANDWEASQSGISSATVADGAAYGFAFGSNNDLPNAPAAIPEASALGLLLLGGALVSCRFRNR